MSPVCWSSNMRYFSPAVLIGYALCVADDCYGVGKKSSCENRYSPVKCYECQTYNNKDCFDPFNESDSVGVVTCRGACAKWVLRPKNGPMNIIRACSNKLNLNINYAHVCMQESRPGDGSLCFCHRDLCNQSTSLHSNTHHLSRIIVTLMLALISMVLARWQVTSSHVSQHDDVCCEDVTAGITVQDIILRSPVLETGGCTDSTVCATVQGLNHRIVVQTNVKTVMKDPCQRTGRLKLCDKNCITLLNKKSNHDT